MMNWQCFIPTGVMLTQKRVYLSPPHQPSLLSLSTFLFPSAWLLFCFVLFCFVLFCFVLFCFVLFCFVLFCFVLFCFVLFCFVLFCFVLFCFVLFCFVKLNFLALLSKPDRETLLDQACFDAKLAMTLCPTWAKPYYRQGRIMVFLYAGIFVALLDLLSSARIWCVS